MFVLALVNDNFSYAFSLTSSIFWARQDATHTFANTNHPTHPLCSYQRTMLNAFPLVCVNLAHSALLSKIVVIKFYDYSEY